MNKKILIGSMLVFIMLLLMPTIPAIQHKVVKDEILSEVTEDLDLMEIRDLIETGKLDRVKHPILGLLVTMWMYFRLIRCQIFADISYDITYDYDWNFEIYYPILFIRLLILLVNTGLVVTFFEGLSNIFDWNWNIPY